MLARIRLSRRWPSPQGLALLALLCAPALAQQTGTLRGAVLDSATGQPIARVLVESPTGGPGVLTDSSGRFSFTNVQAGSVQVRYRRPGYFDVASGQANATRILSFSPGMPEVALSLEPAATLRGQLLLPEGDPASGIRVDLYEAQVTAGHRHWRVRESQPVHSDGSFEFAELQAGTFLLHSQVSIDPTPARTPPAVRSGYPPLFAPGVGDIQAATTFTLLPGQAADVKLTLHRATFYPVSITTAGEAGPGSFQITGNGFTNWSPRWDRESDSLTTELPSGDYLLHASGGGRQTLAGELPFHVAGGPTTGLSVTVNQLSPIPVDIVVRDDAGSASNSSAPRLTALQFIPATTPEAATVTGTVEQDDQGASGIRRGIPSPGEYWVVPLASGGYTASLTSGGVNLLSEPLVIAPGKSPEITAEMSTLTGSVAVTPAGALLTEPCSVQLLPLSAGGISRNGAVAGSADSASPITWSGLPPGDYLAVAIHSHQSIAYREPGVLQQLQGARVTVTAGGSAQATLSSCSAPPPGATGAS